MVSRTVKPRPRPPSPPLPAAVRLPSPLICPDGKWAYRLCGSLGFLLLNGKLEGLQSAWYLQEDDEDDDDGCVRGRAAGLTVLITD